VRRSTERGDMRVRGRGLDRDHGGGSSFIWAQRRHTEGSVHSHSSRATRARTRLSTKVVEPSTACREECETRFF
jgi:hypothetical protein